MVLHKPGVPYVDGSYSLLVIYCKELGYDCMKVDPMCFDKGPL